MATVFNMLRPNDLIWSFVVNNYMRGKPPLPFDLLTWNSDSTRMTAANHSFYLRNCYLKNSLAKGEMVIDGETLDLGEVTIPIYNLATREDHIAPARSVFTGAKLFPGEMRYVLAGSGHIAGVINPADSGKYHYWTGSTPARHASLDEWLSAATEHQRQLVARLGAMARRASARESAGAHARQCQTSAALRRARRICAREELNASSRPDFAPDSLLLAKPCRSLRPAADAGCARR